MFVNCKYWIIDHKTYLPPFSESAMSAVLRIRTSLTNWPGFGFGSSPGSKSGSCSFRHRPFRWQLKINFFFFLLISFWSYIYIFHRWKVIKKSSNSRNPGLLDDLRIRNIDARYWYAKMRTNCTVRTGTVPRGIILNFVEQNLRPWKADREWQLWGRYWAKRTWALCRSSWNGVNDHQINKK